MGLMNYWFIFVFLFTAACSVGSDNQNAAVIETWNISEGRQSCGESSCLQISRECPDGQSCAADMQSVRLDEIAGFNYEDGYRYRLVVKVLSVENPRPTESTQRYFLVGIIEKSLFLVESR